MPLRAAAAIAGLLLLLALEISEAYVKPWQGMWSRRTGTNSTRGGVVEARKIGMHPVGIQSLYSSGAPVVDPNRQYRTRMVVLGVTKAKKPVAKSEREQRLDGLIKGEWIMKEKSLERPSTEEMKDKNFKPRQIQYEEDLLFDSGGSVMIMNPDTIGYGMGWRWEKLDDMYQAPTISFRINRKGVGVDFEEYEDDMNKSPSMFFYSGTFSDPEFKKIEGVIQRNRDLVTVPGQPRVVVNVGTFQMAKVD